MNKIELIKKMCAENPENAEMLYLLGLEYKEAGQLAEAVGAYSEALKRADGELFDKLMQELSAVRTLKTTAGTGTAALEKNWAETAGQIGEGKASGTYRRDKSNESDEPDEPRDESADYEEPGRDEEQQYFQEDEPDSALLTGDELGKFRILKGGNPSGNTPARETGLSEIRFQDVGGLEELKNSIRMKIIKPFLTPGLFERFKKKSGGGLLLFGPPGCGKTFIARATAGECSAVFKPVHITDVLDPYFGQSAQNIKDIFSTARAHKPCILFFDEIDTIGFNRAKSSTDMMRSIVDQLLSEIEGIDSNTERILIIGATNMPWDVDPALRRPGRFDRTVFVPPPDTGAREVIFRLKMQGRPADPMDYKLLARETELFSGADIENVIETATEYVLEEIMATGNERNLRLEDVMKALRSTRPSTLEWLRTIANYVKYANQSGVYSDVEAYLSKHKKYL